MPKPICIYHGNCADGFTAAWAVWRKFKHGFDYHPGVYQEAPPDVVGRDVLLVDFSYKRPVLLKMAAVANSIIILDHHKTAAEDLAGFRPPAPFEDWDNPGFPLVSRDPEPIAALFDMERSGAMITWDFLHRKPAPELVRYVQDRDLWKFDLPGSREVSAFIFAHAYTFENWDYLNEMVAGRLTEVVAGGGAIEKKHHKDVAELVAVCKRRMTIGGHDVWVASLPYTLTSDAGHLMAQGEPFAACYWDTTEGRVFSLRSADDGMDVSEIAKQYGGGGHRAASGFRVPRDHELARL